MKGEFDSPSKAATDAYRAGYDRIWGSARLDPELGKQIVEQWQWLLNNPQHIAAACAGYYPNGCPILNEDLGTDQPHGTTA